MVGYENRDPMLGEGLKVIGDHGRRARIEPGKWLVDEQHGRLGGKRPNNLNASSFPPAEGLATGCCDARKLKTDQHVLPPADTLGAWKTEPDEGCVNVLGDGEASKYGRSLWKIAYSRTGSFPKWPPRDLRAPE